MPAFDYKALDSAGRTKRGVLSADNQRLARKELRRLNLTPIELSNPRDDTGASGRGRRPQRLKPNELVVVTRQLAALIDASTPLEEALNAVANQNEKAAGRSRLLAVRERVMEGWRFADALGEHPRSFPPLYRAVIAAGETSGDLAGVLERLATMLEKNRAIKNKAIASLIYPAVLATVAGGVVTALMVFVVPKIIDQFSAFDADLPMITQIVVGLSNAVVDYGLYALLAAIAAGAAFWRAMKEEPVKLAFDRAVLNVPIVGNLARAVEGARFSRTLATLFSGGAPLLESLIGAQRTIANSFIRKRLDVTVTMVGEGATLASSLRRAGVLPPMLVHMVAAGERAGALPVLLDKAALQMEEEFDTASTVVLRLLEPLIIVAMGGAVVMIVLSILLPILKLNSLAAG